MLNSAALPRLSLLLAAATLLSPGGRASLSAQLSWTAPGAGDWFVASNWSGGLVPTTQDLAEVANGGHAQAAAGTVEVNRLEVGRNTGAGSFTSTGASVRVDFDFDVGEVTGDVATAGATIQSNGTVTLQDVDELVVGVDLDGDFDIGQAGSNLGGTAVSTASATLLRLGDIIISNNLEVAPASANSNSTSTAGGQLTIDQADTLEVLAEFNVGSVNGAGTASSQAEATFANIASASIGGMANIGTARGVSSTGNTADGTLVIDSSVVSIGLGDPLNLEDLSIGDVSTAGAGVLHGRGVVSVSNSQLTVGNRIDVARLTGGSASSTSFGRLALVDSHAMADDLTVAEVGSGILGSATGEVFVDSSLVELSSNLTLGNGSTLELTLAGTTRADGNGGAQYSAIDATAATLDGLLKVTLADGFMPAAGQSFLLLATPTIGGNFSAVDLPDLTAMGLGWATETTASGYAIRVVGDSLAGDYNRDGVVNLADYTVWRDTLGSTSNLAADGDDSKTIDAADYAVWKNNFGSGNPLLAAAHTAAVPEPTSAALSAAVALLAWVGLRRARGGTA